MLVGLGRVKERRAFGYGANRKILNQSPGDAAKRRVDISEMSNELANTKIPH
jgi:hypothetical protein